ARRPLCLHEADRKPLTRTRGVTVTGFGASMCSAWFPPGDPPVGHALPFTGSSGASSPASTVLWRGATPCLPFAALRCLRLAIPDGASEVSLPSVPNARPRARGSSSGPLCRHCPPGDGQGIPSSWRTSIVCSPCSRRGRPKEGCRAARSISGRSGSRRSGILFPVYHWLRLLVCASGPRRRMRKVMNEPPTLDPAALQRIRRIGGTKLLGEMLDL